MRLRFDVDPGSRSRVNESPLRPDWAGVNVSPTPPHQRQGRALYPDPLSGMGLLIALPEL
jgi:hypothetical protein